MPFADTPPVPGGSRRDRFAAVVVLLLYFVLTATYTYPLLRKLDAGLPVDAGDPGLATSILSWSARTVPFSNEWWNAPQYFPTEGIASFTESLVGFVPFSSPVIWLTGSALAGYNVAVFLTWPLTGFAGYLLVYRLTRRHDAGFIAGLAMAFNPYRYDALGHIHMLATAWMPLMLLAMHAYLENRRIGWLFLFAAAWLLNSLSNGHYMLFAAVLTGLWLVYFGSTRRTWRPAAILGFTFAVSSIPLVPIFLKYQAIHDYFNLHRAESEIIYFSAQAPAWGRISYNIWFWSKFLPNDKDNFFPGLTALTLILTGIGVVLWRRRTVGAGGVLARRIVRALLITGMVASLIALVTGILWGAWEWNVRDIRIYKMTDLSRALKVLTFCTAGLFLMTRSLRDAVVRRSPLLFYTFGILAFAVLACGPVLRAGEKVVQTPMPYRWLMSLPGFMELRVPARFWMLGVICLSTAAGIAYAHLVRSSRRSLTLVAGVVVTGFIVLDSWIPSLPIAGAPARWAAETPDLPEPILELPIGPDDYGATFRTLEHRRRLVNGVSGYNPPYYLALAEGLQRLDPASLAAVTSFGALDVVVHKAADENGDIRRYVTAFPGSQQTVDDGEHVAFRLPKGQPEPPIGPDLPIVSVRVRGGRNVVGDVRDGKMETGWGETPQTPDQSVLIDLGSPHDVAGVSQALGDYYLDFPRHLVVDLSLDGTNWTSVWDSPTMGPMTLAWVRAPRVADMRMVFPSHPARFVRVRQTEDHFRMWRISEISVHGPIAR